MTKQKRKEPPKKKILVQIKPGKFKLMPAVRLDYRMY